MPRPLLMLAVLAGILALPIAISANRLVGARSQLATAQASLVQASGDARRILELRAKQETIAEHTRPDQDVIARVNSVLAETGIPQVHFGGLRPESDSALPTTGGPGGGPSPYRRQSVRVTFNEITVSQLGGFLGAWEAAQPLWAPSRIELKHSRQIPEGRGCVDAVAEPVRLSTD